MSQVTDLSATLDAHRAEAVEILRTSGFTSAHVHGAAVGQPTRTPTILELVADASPLAAIGDVLAAEDLLSALFGVPVRLVPSSSDRGRAALENEDAAPKPLDAP